MWGFASQTHRGSAMCDTVYILFLVALSTLPFVLQSLLV